MWARINVPVSVEMYKGGIGNCDGDGDATATAWVCSSTGRGGWNPIALRARSVKENVALDATVRSVMAHEVGHLVVAKYGATSKDFVTNELRADCLAAGYSRWTTTTPYSAMGELPLHEMKRALPGDRRNAAVQAGYDGNPQKCLEYTP